MTKRTTKNPSRRVQVELELAQRLAELAIPELSNEFLLPSITRVELTRDLKDGVVWITAAPEVDHAAIVAAATDRLPAWRQAARQHLSLRYFPNLTIRYDEGQADLITIEHLLEHDAHKTS